MAGVKKASKALAWTLPFASSDMKYQEEEQHAANTATRSKRQWVSRNVVMGCPIQNNMKF